MLNVVQRRRNDGALRNGGWLYCKLWRVSNWLLPGSTMTAGRSGNNNDHRRPPLYLPRAHELGYIAPPAVDSDHLPKRCQTMDCMTLPRSSNIAFDCIGPSENKASRFHCARRVRCGVSERGTAAAGYHGELHPRSLTDLDIHIHSG